MSGFKGTSYHLFDFTKQKLAAQGTVYTPAFATSDGTFWQLCFRELTKGEELFYEIFLNAVPDRCEEQNIEGNWPKRKGGFKLSVLKMDKTELATCMMKSYYSSKAKSWGFRQLKSSFPEKFLIGVEFETEFMSKPIDGPFPDSKPPALVEAWAKNLNNPETSDVKIEIDGKIIYASSVLLRAQSGYFDQILGVNWTESSRNVRASRHRRNRSTNNISRDPTSVMDFKPVKVPGRASEVPSTGNNDVVDKVLSELRDKPSDITTSPPPPLPLPLPPLTTTTTTTTMTTKKFKYELMIPDVSYSLFSQMLRFLYTGEVTYTPNRPKSRRNVIELYELANKYMISTLIEETRAQIIASLTTKNAAKILFEEAYLWEDLKKPVMEYVATNFAEISKTTQYTSIIKHRNDYYHFSELNSEILLTIYKMKMSWI